MSAPPPSVDWAEVGPGLLEALRWVMSAHGEQLHDAFAAAHEAIARATPGGETGT